jgi:hypothetical protein
MMNSRISVLVLESRQHPHLRKHCGSKGISLATSHTTTHHSFSAWVLFLSNQALNYFMLEKIQEDETLEAFSFSHTTKMI